MKTIFISVLMCNICTMALFSQEEKLEVQGAIKIGTIETITDSVAAAGTMRWTGTDFEGWDGYTWKSLTGKTQGSLNDVGVIDIDGNVYDTVTIGTQLWMAENLRTTRYNDSTVINQLNDPTLWGSADASGTAGWCWYDTLSTYEDIYGKLYNWYAVSSTKLCPTGWHVPIKPDWVTLKTYLDENGYGFGGSGDDFGKALASTTGWATSNTAGNVGNNQSTNNTTGFNGKPGGYRRASGSSFVNAGQTAFWWSLSLADVPNQTNAIQFLMFYGNDLLSEGFSDKKHGYSVRCIKTDD